MKIHGYLIFIKQYNAGNPESASLIIKQPTFCKDTNFILFEQISLKKPETNTELPGYFGK